MEFVAVFAACSLDPGFNVNGWVEFVDGHRKVRLCLGKLTRLSVCSWFATNLSDICMGTLDFGRNNNFYSSSCSSSNSSTNNNVVVIFNDKIVTVVLCSNI